jgi:hypothetical protein
VNPFEVLGLPARPDLTDAQVRAAWRAIAADTHPDRPGGDITGYTTAANAYAQLRTAWGRSEAYADLAATGPLVPAPATAPAHWPVTAGWRDLRLVPARIRHGRPLRLAARAIAAGLLSLLVLILIPGQAAGPAVVTGLVIWFLLTARADLAPPPGR